MGVHVVTDSSAVVPAAWLEDVPLHVIPVEIAWEDGTTSSGDMSFHDLNTEVARGRRPPKTAAPSPGRYAKVYEELLARASGLVVLCPSADLSTTYSNAVLGAREHGDERVRVVDTRTAAAGQGIVAVETARAAAAGEEIDAVAARAADVARATHIWATLEQLEYLRRSGRLPSIAAIGAGALRLQPVVRYAGGAPGVVAVTRSSRRSTERLFRAWERSVTADARLVVVAFHSGRQVEAGRIVNRIRETTPGAQSAIVEVTAALASHTGPGLLGLAWFWDHYTP